jgi:hypothetical protein
MYPAGIYVLYGVLALVALRARPAPKSVHEPGMHLTDWAESGDG